MADNVQAPFPLARNTGLKFATAAKSYTDHGGEGRYLPRIIEHFADQPLASITPFDVKQMCLTLYPSQSNSTRNRQGLTPTRAVLVHAYERGWCTLMRLTRFKQEAPRRKSPASPAWLQVFVRQADIDALPHLGALVLFMSQSGARISEAVALRWREVDLVGRRVLLLKTKTGTNSVRHLTDAMIGRLRKLAETNGADPDAHVFRYSSRYSVNERIAAVCHRAGISYKSPHACGRHSFATNALAMGADVKSAMEAGDWKSVEVFMGVYVHVHNAGRLVADRFNGIDFGAL